MGGVGEDCATKPAKVELRLKTHNAKPTNGIRFLTRFAGSLKLAYQLVNAKRKRLL